MEMDSYVIAALIALIGVIISVTGSTLGSYFTNKSLNNKNFLVQKEIANKNIDANLKAKSRIEWINAVRSKSSSFITITFKYRSLSDWTLRKIEEISTLSLKESDENKQKIKQLSEDISLKFLKLDSYGYEAFNLLIVTKLYFSDNLEHDEIMKKFDELMLCMTNNKNFLMKKDIQNAKKSIELIPTYQIELTTLLRKYLKKEWEKAKNGK